MHDTLFPDLLPRLGKDNGTGKIVHLPAAPQAVARTRFSPPPPRHSNCLSIAEAVELLELHMKGNCTPVTMAAITGPGDPLATPEITLEMVRQIRNRFPALPIGLLTLGIGSSKLAGDLARAGVNYVEMRVEGVRSAVLEKIFAWIRPGARTLKLAEAIDLLLQEQRSGVSALTFHSIAVSIVTTLYPGYNIDHVARISAEMLELGATGIALPPYAPELGAEVDLQCPTAEEIAGAVVRAQANLPVFTSLLHRSPEDTPDDDSTVLPSAPAPNTVRPNVAVASSNGIEVDLHLGHAIRFLIYGRRDDGLACLLETRSAAEPGSGDRRWLEIAETLRDCFILLCAGAGQNPRRILAEQGIRVHICEENIEGMVDVLFGGGKKKKKRQQKK